MAEDGFQSVRIKSDILDKAEDQQIRLGLRSKAQTVTLGIDVLSVMNGDELKSFLERLDDDNEIKQRIEKVMRIPRSEPLNFRHQAFSDAMQQTLYSF